MMIKQMINVMNLGLTKEHENMLRNICHSRNFLSGIWFKTRFPLKTCGNDKSRGFSGEKVIRQILTVILVLTAVVSYGAHSACADETDWTMHMKVSVPDAGGADGTVWNHLIAGVQRGATDGYDKSRDTVAWLEKDDPVQATFVHATGPEE